MDLVYRGEVPVFEKYDEFLPEELVKKGLAYGILGIEEMKMRIAAGSAVNPFPCHVCKVLKAKVLIIMSLTFLHQLPILHSVQVGKMPVGNKLLFKPCYIYL